MKDFENDEVPRLERIQRKLKMKEGPKINHGKIKHHRTTDKNRFYGKDRFIRN